MTEECKEQNGNRQPLFNVIYGLSILFLNIPGVTMTCIGYGDTDDKFPDALNIAGPVMLGTGGFFVFTAVLIALIKDFVNKEPRCASFHLRVQKDSKDLAWQCVYNGLPMACVGFTISNFEPLGVTGAIVLMVGVSIYILGSILGKFWKPKEFYTDEELMQVTRSCSSESETPEPTRMRYRFLYLRAQRNGFNDLSFVAFIAGLPLVCVGYLAGPNERVFCAVLGTVFMCFSAQMLSQSMFTVWCGSYGITGDYDIYYLRQTVIRDIGGRCLFAAIILTPVGFTQEYGLAIGITGAVCGGINGILWFGQMIYKCVVKPPPYPADRKCGEGFDWKKTMSMAMYHTAGVTTASEAKHESAEELKNGGPPPSYDNAVTEATM